MRCHGHPIEEEKKKKTMKQNKNKKRRRKELEARHGAWNSEILGFFDLHSPSNILYSAKQRLKLGEFLEFQATCPHNHSHKHKKQQQNKKEERSNNENSRGKNTTGKSDFGFRWAVTTATKEENQTLTEPFLNKQLFLFCFV